MNILFIVNELRYTCGVTNHILHLSKGLAETGKVKLSILCGGGNGLDRFNDINVNIVSDKRFFHRNRSIPQYISAITFLAKFIRKNKIEIVHSHTHYSANIARRASKIIRTVTIQTNHGLLRKKGRLKHFNSDKYIAINEHIYDYLLSNKIAEKNNISFIRCGIPIDKVAPAKGKENITVLAASKFSYEKGLDTFINAVSLLDNITKGKADFFIAGEGETESSLKELNNKLNSNIQFLGNVNDIYALLRKNHIFVYPSRSKSEGFPAVISEAGATANLVISSDFEGAAPVMKNNEDCIIFQRENPDDLMKKLAGVINNYTDYEGFALKFYNKVKELFDLKTMIDKHIILYENCLKR